MNAKKTIAAFFLNCPKCDAGIPAPCGSFMWSVDDAIPASVTCPECGQTLKVRS